MKPSENPLVARKLGRAVGKSKRRALQLDLDRHLKAGALPVIPDEIDLSKPWPTVYLAHNDVYGSCGAAAMANGLSIEAKKEGREAAFASSKTVDDDALALYLKFTGGQDTGVILLDWLNWLQIQPNGFLGEKIGTPIAINPGKWEEVALALGLGYSLYLGADVTYACVEAQPGTFWRTEVGDQTIDGGHCIAGAGALKAGSFGQPNMSLISWKEKYYTDWLWWTSKVDEGYILLDESRSSSAFNIDVLRADIAAMQAAGE